MAEGEADIDPDGPDLNLLQMEQLAKSVALMDAADQEMLTLMYNDRKRYNEMIGQIRRLYYLRIVALSLLSFGLTLVICALIWFMVADKKHLTNLQKCEWSEWQDNVNSQHSSRQICGAVQYGPYYCDHDCHDNQKLNYTILQPDFNDLNLWHVCSNKTTDKIYVKNKNI